MNSKFGLSSRNYIMYKDLELGDKTSNMEKYQHDIDN